MTMMRFKALETAASQSAKTVVPPSNKISDYFNANVFSKPVMKEYLSKEAYESLINSIEHSMPLDRTVADQIAAGLKGWAISKGATHYTHWFQPLTGLTAEKHDSFFEPTHDGRSLERFSGDALVQQEPDASSFPNGGIRSTFEARGYTAWDPSSPAFIIESKAGATLCIPTVFISYTGEALDFKAPLLKAIRAVDEAATAVCRLFDQDVKKVVPSLGVEQEYFLIDEALFYARQDLIATGRTLLGHESARNQQLEDHYFGSIPERVHSFMADFEIEAHKLGIPLKTRHNEVAPGQFECAPIYEEINLAIDHNQLLMDIMDKVARRHHLKVLLHEKPFAGVNGSGKHNNWSLITNTGKNLLSPGKTPKNNLLFLTFLSATIKAVHTHADLLRSSIASINNDHRLGANEAPPAIISIFLGQTLDHLLNEIEHADFTEKNKANQQNMELNIPKIPQILLDNTDRNRTSPFAFTGNKFEFRAVGSSANCAQPMTVLNAIVADQLNQFRHEVETRIKNGEKKDTAIMDIVHRYVIESKSIRFEGNGYSEEWTQEAAKRGLSNIKTTPKALDAMVSPKSEELFERLGIFTKRELHARHEIFLENYAKKLQIESNVLGDLTRNHIIPVALKYQNTLIENARGLKELGLDHSAYDAQLDMLKEISASIAELKLLLKEMCDERKKVSQLHNVREQAIAYDERVRSFFYLIRKHTDKLEMMVDDAQWPLPKFRELLFVR